MEKNLCLEKKKYIIWDRNGGACEGQRIKMFELYTQCIQFCSKKEVKKNKKVCDGYEKK